MQGDENSNDRFSLLSGDAITMPPEDHDDMFTAEFHDLELRLEQLELEQRSLRIQLQRTCLRHVEHIAMPSATPSSTVHSQSQQTSVRHSSTPGRTLCLSGALGRQHNNPYSHTGDTNAAHRVPAAQTPALCTPQAGNCLDATGQVLCVGDKVSFLAMNYTTGGTGIVRHFMATFIIIRRSNGGEIHCAPSNVTRLHMPTH